MQWEYERRGEYTFRVSVSKGKFGFLAQAVLGGFVDKSCVLCLDNLDMWFAYGDTKEAALSLVSKDVLQ